LTALGDAYPSSTMPAVVLCIGGHDPSTAGIQADIETCAAFDCLALTVVSAWTTQNTASLQRVVPAAADDLVAQIELLLEEFPIHACKLGLIPTVAHCERLAELLSGPLAQCPVVIDPLLRAGSGGALVQEAVESAFLALLLPHGTVVTPNRTEALHFGAAEDTQTAVARLLASGCRAVLLTDALHDGGDIVNQLHLRDGNAESFAMARYPGDYHGTGCTLATAIACGLARGRTLRDAVVDAQNFVHTAVARAWRPGSRQHIPRRTPSSSV
jgi:hydroxymethylpyrimidine/phosphomethylpyrimidine kinase